MTQPPRISVVVPTHNRPDLLSEALLSLLHQTIKEWEAIVVDDASNPPVSSVYSSEINDDRIRVLRHPLSKGGAEAKNTGIISARGDIVAFLDDDDLYEEDFLESAVNVLDKHSEIDVVFMGVSWFGDNAKWGEIAYQSAMNKILCATNCSEIEPSVLLLGSGLIPSLLKSVPMAFQRPVVRRRIYEDIGDYRSDCLLWDCDWAIRASIDVNAALVIDGKYLQRTNNQGFSSRPERHLEHLQSNANMHDDLLNNVSDRHDKQHLIQLLRESSAQSWFNLAYHYSTINDSAMAFRAWWESQKRHLNIRRLKFLARLFIFK